MSIQENVRIVKDFFAAIGRGDKQALLALCADDIEWVIPGEGWPLAGTHRGHAGVANVLQQASKLEIASEASPEYLAQRNRVMVVGVARGRVKATDKTFEDHWVFAMTIRNGRVANIREYVDTQALAQASAMRQS